MSVVEFKDESVVRALTKHAQRKPDSVAVICESRQVTYAKLDKHSDTCAHALRDLGVSKGTRVGFLGKESELYYEVFFGCAKAEAVLVPFNWRLTVAEIDHIVDDSGTTLLFVEPEFLGLAQQIQAQRRHLSHLVLLRGTAPTGVLEFESLKAITTQNLPALPLTGPDDPVIQLYTSGTTGLPKGVVLAQRSFFRIRQGLLDAGLDWIDWLDTDVSLVGIPGFHVAGIWWAMQAFIAGVPSVVLPSFKSQEAVRAIREHGVTTTLVVPAMLRMMLNEPVVGPNDFTSLRKIAYGGSPIEESLLDQAIAVFRCQFVQLYGLTETGNAALCLPAEEHIKGSPRMRSAGRPLPGVRVKVINELGMPLEAGAIGEVCVHSPAVMLEYWQRPDATQETLTASGWLRTGDAGHIDSDGYLYISDRIKDMVIVAGENVYPAEVENGLSKHASVAEVAVVGVPDPRWGEAVLAVIVLKAGHRATARELMLFLRGLLADFKVPTQYQFVDSLPRNPSGKLLRRVLREAYWSRRQRKVN